MASIFETYIFPYFGVPKIFQSDNGKEFVNSVIGKLLRSWSADIQTYKDAHDILKVRG